MQAAEFNEVIAGEGQKGAVLTDGTVLTFTRHYTVRDVKRRDVLYRLLQKPIQEKLRATDDPELIRLSQDNPTVFEYATMLSHLISVQGKRKLFAYSATEEQMVGGFMTWLNLLPEDYALIEVTVDHVRKATQPPEVQLGVPDVTPQTDAEKND